MLLQDAPGQMKQIFKERAGTILNSCSEMRVLAIIFRYKVINLEPSKFPGGTGSLWIERDNARSVWVESSLRLQHVLHMKPTNK